MIRCTPTGTPSVTTAKWALEYEPDTDNRFAMMAGSGTWHDTDGTTSYNNVYNHYSWSNTFDRATLIPKSATIKEFYIKRTSSPGTGYTATYELQKNGSTVSTISFSDSEYGLKSNTGLSISIVAGDILRISAVTTSGATGSFVYSGVVFEPETTGESFICGTTTATTAINNYFIFPATVSNSWSSSESDRESLSSGSFILKDFITEIENAPTAGNSWSFYLRKNNVNTSLVTTIADTDTSDSDNTHEVSVADEDSLSLMASSSGSPASTGDIFFGMVQYIVPETIPVEINETISVSEDVESDPVAIPDISVNESISVDELISIGQTRYISCFETINISENIDNPGPIFPPFEINITDSIKLSENITKHVIGSGVKIFFNEINSDSEKSRHVVPTSLTISNILTRQVDRATFSIKKYGDVHTYIPTTGSEIFIYIDGVREFAGFITRITQRAEQYKIIYYDIECEDYTRLLDRKLIADTYSETTIGNIINSLRDRYFRDIFVAQIDDSETEIAYAGFNYETASSCLTTLADKLNFDWYIDYYKNLYFISKTSFESPFNVSDSNDTYIFETFTFRQDTNQIKNRVFVAGGEYLADTFTTEFQSDGIQNVYSLPYKYDDISVSVTGEVWEQGIDGNDAISTKDYLWNSSEKFIRFRGDRVPSISSAIRISGQPYLPVRIIAQDDTSIATMKDLEGGDGIYEYIIVDDAINSQEGARERANAELEAYKNSLSEGSFTTKKSGLKAGQVININSSVYGVSGDYLINSVRTRMKNNIEQRYDVSIVSMKTTGIIEVLQKLLNAGKKFNLGDQDIIDNVRGYSESIDLSEEFDAQVDYAVEFVMGSYPQPTEDKRVFVLDRSPLGNGINPYSIQTVSIYENVEINIS